MTPGTAQVAAKRAPFRFERVPAGTWVLRAFQDVNGNGKLDTGAFGPTEPTGNHRAARPRFRAPRFDEMAFVVGADLTQLVVELH